MAFLTCLSTYIPLAVGFALTAILYIPLTVWFLDASLALPHPSSFLGPMQLPLVVLLYFVFLLSPVSLGLVVSIQRHRRQRYIPW